MRFFFDLKNERESVLDFRGEEFGHHDAAIDFAKAIATDMTHRMSAEWLGWSVEVWNAAGLKLVAVPVGTAEAA
jgi:hypothetical protein